jgi:hypothetical protein
MRDRECHLSGARHTDVLFEKMQLQTQDFQYAEISVGGSAGITIPHLSHHCIVDFDTTFPRDFDLSKLWQESVLHTGSR